MTYLEHIDSPSDLKKLSRVELADLAAEIRDVIVTTVSKNGGHLASSMGVVELTIALHYVFDVPKDKLIWDVGHQSYAHKLLTGRRDQFQTLRTLGGLSGFPKRCESIYDTFTTGHSSTSISAGYGIACALDIKGDHSKVISVIGDGSMTGGIAFEGLNQAGSNRKNQLVILNDNDMSISKNVGALSSFLSRAFSAKYLHDLRDEFKKFFKSLPMIGDDIYKFAKKSEESFKTFVTPGMLFEAFDYEYMGPIDGHNLDHLINILENIKGLAKPIVLHVTTTKGKGYLPAETNPTYFHGVGAFEVDTGDAISRGQAGPPTYTEVFGRTMIELARENDTLVAITAAMPEGTGLSEFSTAYPERFFDVGIAEQHGVTFAAGMATEGFKPVVAIYSTFLQRAYDQIVHDVCIESLPVVFAVDRGGIVGEDGPTHQGLFDYAYLRSIPGMVVMAPKDENELRRMLKTAVDHYGPIAVRYPRGKGLGIPLDPVIEPIPIGKAEVLADGEDLLILAIGRTVVDAMAARDILAAEAISTAVINARFVKPLDHELILSYVQKVKAVVTIEDHVKNGGFGSAVLECLADHGMTGIPVKRLGVDDVFVEHGSQNELRNKYGIGLTAVLDAARILIGSHG
ncbi:1-deoxy-D-xylulose-5-phosphate synthase [Desulfatiferula olefinivorans]